MWPSRRRGFQRRSHMGLMLLFIQLCQAGFDRIPPVTLGTIALNVAVYLGMIHQFFKQQIPHPLEICAGVVQVWHHRDYWRIIEATFHHANDWHLYYNMVSFLWKGMWLERKIGSVRFLYMIGVFTVLVNTVMLYLNYFVALILNDPSYINQCALGFSGVVFAVKVVTTHMMPRSTSMIMGFIPVNSRFACWLELLLIQVLIPNASFTGHLAGILVGLAYVQETLRRIVEWPLAAFTRPAYAGPSYTYYSGTTSSTASSAWAADDANVYTGGLDENEQIRRATEESLREQNYPARERLYPDLSSEMNGRAREVPSAPPGEQDHEQPHPYGWNIPNSTSLDQDDIRRRRLEHFSNISRR
ncbi:rhomboid-related protein 4-like isoform X1 [Clavelina lepadiformis]|uniref:Peptidase S54 rhomboid domain-containing protein n=2 Tax=Clavelina lepadiformis TaxID=159417 RepID=A0ABP0FG02_CLALP